eukprot:scaffold269903_cov28-Tisochrysis_lutea.AAC.3
MSAAAPPHYPLMTWLSLESERRLASAISTNLAIKPASSTTAEPQSNPTRLPPTMSTCSRHPMPNMGRKVWQAQKMAVTPSLLLRETPPKAKMRCTRKIPNATPTGSSENGPSTCLSCKIKLCHAA